MRRYGWPIAPAVIGLILGPIAETNLRRALAIGEGDVSVLVASGFSKAVLSIALIILVVGVVTKVRARRAGHPLEQIPTDVNA